MAASAPPVFTAQAHPDPVQTEFLPVLDGAATYHPQPIIKVNRRNSVPKIIIIMLAIFIGDYG